MILEQQNVPNIHLSNISSWLICLFAVVRSMATSLSTPPASIAVDSCFLSELLSLCSTD